MKCLNSKKLITREQHFQLKDQVFILDIKLTMIEKTENITKHHINSRNS